MSVLKKVFVTASLLCGVAWLVKIAAIAATGGTRTDGGVIAVLWAVGMLCLFLSAATGAALMFRRRPGWLRVLLAIVAVPVSFVVLNVLDGLAKSVYRSEGWFRDELGLVVLGVVVAAVGLRAMASGGERVTSLDLS